MKCKKFVLRDYDYNQDCYVHCCAYLCCVKVEDLPNERNSENEEVEEIIVGNYNNNNNQTQPNSSVLSVQPLNDFGGPNYVLNTQNNIPAEQVVSQHFISQIMPPAGLV